MALPKTYVREEDYLEMERASETKHEYYNGEVFEMAGASRKHTIITMNTGASLHAQLRKRPCTVHQSDLRVKIPATRFYTYPDVVVVCGEALFDDRYEDILLNPTLIAEVLSPSTEAYDRGEKFRLYRTSASLQEYLLISQEKVYIEHFQRDGDAWRLQDADALEAVITLSSIGCTLALADVYEKVRFEEADSQDRA